MAVRTMLVVLAVLLVSFPSWAMAAGGGGGGAGVGVPMDLLLPGQPTNVTAVAGDGMATISFDPPKSDGGSRITGYTVKSHPGGIRAKGDASPIVVRGLTNGKKYKFTVGAGNSAGMGPSSEPSNGVVPGRQ